MRKSVVSQLLASLAPLAMVWVAEGALAADGKYGVVDMQQVILSVEEGKAARAQLEGEIKAKESELQKQKEELDKMNNEWKNQAALLSEDARMKKQQEFQEKFLAPSFIFSIVSSPEEFAARIRTESAKWGKVIKDANVKVE